jgi:hypothetical protein
MRFRRTVFAVLVAVFSLPLIALVAYWWREREGIRNYTVCKTLRQGISVSELISRMGDPVAREEIDEDIWLRFQTPGVLSGQISAQVDERNDKVLLLRCD